MEKKIAITLCSIFASLVIGSLAWLMINVSELKGDMKVVMYKIEELKKDVDLAQLENLNSKGDL